MSTSNYEIQIGDEISVTDSIALNSGSLSIGDKLKIVSIQDDSITFQKVC